MQRRWALTLSNDPPSLESWMSISCWSHMVAVNSATCATIIGRKLGCAARILHSILPARYETPDRGREGVISKQEEPYTAVVALGCTLISRIDKMVG